MQTLDGRRRHLGRLETRLSLNGGQGDPFHRSNAGPRAEPRRPAAGEAPPQVSIGRSAPLIPAAGPS